MSWQGGVLQELDISKLRPMDLPFHGRQDGVEELASSIADKGLLHPLVVRPKDGYYEVVAGNRRLAALRMLGRRKAPCLVVDMDDKSAYELALVENLQRRNLNPIEEAMAFKAYIEMYGYGSESELARRIGKSQEYVSRRLQLLRLPQKVQEEVMRRRIAPSIAAELATIDDPGKIEELAGVIVEKGLRREHVRRAIREEKGAWRVDDPYDRRRRLVDRVMNKCITSLKVALVNMDDAIEDVKDDWLLYEMLMEHRSRLHAQIDDLIRLRKHVVEMNEVTA
ncbi:ParB/RepB/Spo0J family partition protein [Conexivisphaera calida]|uniref:Chromosome (Plasmid) partitioning protein ParB n=1 Tax=Conexivisphaera calida TaxID=1874277 RepID=A0A4P2VN18_9ARCH|nr:ParB/RepB/Spo0J family partition protein [Conexivisphaera calida]BBE42358.1 Chromosome (plasmid) partitioning protein ParB [Conexivisphaera calida]